MWPLPIIIFVGLLIACVIATLHTLPILGGIHGAGVILYGFSIANRDYYDIQYEAFTMFSVLAFTFIVAHILHILIWLGFEVASKWILIGQREEGRYNWDTSTYNQRWEIYQLCTQMRRLGKISFLTFLHGTPYIATFFRLLGCKIGENTCLYPTGGDPYTPEPDMVTIGNNCAVDNAAIVCHLNTRGNFELVSIVLGDDVTLRNKARIQMGCRMEKESMLLEHSLAMTGEVIESGSVWQGCPATPAIYLTSNESRNNIDNFPLDRFDGAII